MRTGWYTVWVYNFLFSWQYCYLVPLFYYYFVIFILRDRFFSVSVSVCVLFAFLTIVFNFDMDIFGRLFVLTCSVIYHRCVAPDEAYCHLNVAIADCVNIIYLFVELCLLFATRSNVKLFHFKWHEPRFLLLLICDVHFQDRVQQPGVKFKRTINFK